MEAPERSLNGGDSAVEEHETTITFVPVSPDQHPAISPERAGHVRGVEGYGLIVERGPRAGMTFVLPPGITTIGRHPEDDIFLDDITVSRHHAVLELEGGLLYVADNESTNGTYVNGERCDRRRVEPGDEIIIGKYHLVVAHGDG